MSEFKGSEPQATTSSPRPQRATSSCAVGGIALVVIVLLVILRGGSELAMMSVHGPDPQMPIWLMLMVVKLAFWSGLGLLAWLLLTLWKTRWGLIAGVVLLVGWALAISAASWSFASGARALADAANPSTSSERLRALVQFHGIQAGYELDNRIASNPNTPQDALRQLYERGQSGTNMKLASNPNTPIEILEKLVHQEDEWVQRSLADNPNLPESLRRELKLPKDE